MKTSDKPTDMSDADIASRATVFRDGIFRERVVLVSGGGTGLGKATAALFEWAPHDIRVNCVAPGTIRTEAFNYYSETGRASFDQANPMLHAGDAWDIAEAIVYVASQAGKFITGEVLNVDGGQQCWGDPWFAGRPPFFELDYSVSRQGGRIAKPAPEGCLDTFRGTQPAYRRHAG